MLTDVLYHRSCGSGSSIVETVKKLMAIIEGNRK